MDYNGGIKVGTMFSYTTLLAKGECQVLESKNSDIVRTAFEEAVWKIKDKAA